MSEASLTDAALGPAAIRAELELRLTLSHLTQRVLDAVKQSSESFEDPD